MLFIRQRVEVLFHGIGGTQGSKIQVGLTGESSILAVISTVITTKSG